MIDSTGKSGWVSGRWSFKAKQQNDKAIVNFRENKTLAKKYRQSHSKIPDFVVNKSNALHFEYSDQSFEKNWEIGAKGGKMV